MTDPVFASVDLGGTNIAATLALASGKVLARESTPTRSYEGPAKVIERIAELVEKLSAAIGQRPAAMGMGVPGLVDVDSGITHFLPNLDGQWRQVPVKSDLEKALKLPTFLLNDARMATLGELAFGHGRRVRDFILYALGTGVGGGTVLDGALRLGALGAASEFGHQVVEPGGVPCSCGSRGCLELYMSGPALAGEGVRLLLAGGAPALQSITGGDANKVNAKTMMQAVAQGDQRVQAAIIRSATYLGMSIANNIIAVHPQAVVLCGGVAGIGPLLLDTIRTVVRERVRMIPTDDIEILVSELGDQAGVLGGIALAMRGGLGRKAG